MSSNLEEYLVYYKDCKKPGYAILVTGDWGVGKTFQIMHAIPEEQRYYVSLFGLHTTDEVVSEVFASMFPTQAKLRKAISAVKDTTVEVGGIGTMALSGLVSGVANAFLRQQIKNDRVIIFDDLERCSLCLKEILGVINLYVEHHGCRVVVIAHDEKLTSEFVDAKEKLFGQTIRVEPQIDSAFKKFVAEFVKEQNFKFFENHMAEIIETFNCSGIGSLRILRHVIEDLARLQNVLSGNYLQNDDAMVELVRLFSALAIEVRRGRIGQEELRERAHVRIAYEVKKLNGKSKNIEPEKPRFVVAAEQYPSINFGSTLLTDEALIQMLIHGRFDQDLIRCSLDNSAYFIKPKEAQPWMVFMQFGELEDEVAETAMRQLMEQFKARKITNPGEILHLFSLRLMMAENGLLEKDYAAVTSECRSYVDDLVSAEKLPSIDLEERFDPFLSRGYCGYAYWVSDAYRKYFNDLMGYLFDAQKTVLRTKFAGLSDELVSLVEEDGDGFYNKVCFSGKGGVYASIPILATISPVRFVSAWMRSHPSNWYSIQQALIDRYQGGRIKYDLKEEANWIQDVITLLENDASAAKGIRKVRINRVIPLSLKIGNFADS